MRSPRAHLALVPSLAAAAALALSACGGDSAEEQPLSTPTETTEELSKTDFIEEADSICQEANTAIAEIAEAGEGVTRADQVAELRQGVAEDIKALGPPQDDRPALDDFLTALEDQVEAGQKIALGTERGDDIAAFESELAAAKTAGATAATAYGFKECGSEETTTTAPGTTAPSAPVTPSAPVAPANPDEGGASPDTGGDTGGGGVGPGGGGVSP